MSRTLVGIAVVLLAACVWLLSGVGDAPPDAAPVSAAAAPEPAPSTERADASAPAAPAPEPLPVADRDAVQEVDPAVLERIRSNERLEEAARRQRLAEAADARWQEAVDGAQYSAQDLDPAVRSLFREVDLEPRYVEGGRIDGLVIQSMVSDHPLVGAGFREGDRIDRIQGMPLRDPADLPSLLSRLGPEIEVCALRGGDGAEHCEVLFFD